MKKLFITGLVAGLMAISTMAFAATRVEIMTAANNVVPVSAEMYSMKEDDAVKTELKYRDTRNNKLYEVEVDKATAKVLEIEVQDIKIVKSNKVIKTQADIEKIVLAEYPDAQNLMIKLDQDGKNYEYEAKFNTAKCYEVDLDINTATGAIVKRDLKFR